jgi:hypothetical protein
MSQPAISHIKAWKRHIASVIKVLWNKGISVKEICSRLKVTETYVDHVVRGNVWRDVGPSVRPRKSYGRNQKRQLRELMEIPG